MKLWPAIEVFEGIVRTVIGAPPDEALQIAAVVEVFPEELLARGHIVRKELSLEHGPSWGGHVRADADRDIRTRRGLVGQPANTPARIRTAIGSFMRAQEQ